MSALPNPILPMNNLPKRMGKAEARELVERIRENLQDCREHLLRLYRHEGWRAMGYSSWRECAAVEFGQSQGQVYRLLDAAKVDEEVKAELANRGISPIGENNFSLLLEQGKIPESHVRELKRLPEAKSMVDVLEQAHQDGDMTAQHIGELVDDRLDELDEEQEEQGGTDPRETAPKGRGRPKGSTKPKDPESDRKRQFVAYVDKALALVDGSFDNADEITNYLNAAKQAV